MRLINYCQSNQHSSFSTAFPIYLWNEVEEEVPVEEEEVHTTESETPEDEDEAIVEEDTEPETTPETKKVMVGRWEHMNSQPPLWMRYVCAMCQWLN
jgi:heat shock protein beta